MIFFRAKTTDGFIFKTLGELLQSNVRISCFEIDENGIYLGMINSNRNMSFKLNLEAKNFCKYKYKRNEKMFIGLNMSHFNQMLKIVKKKDAVELFIDDQHPSDLGIRIFPTKENGRTSTSFIKIQNIQNIKVLTPEGYNRSVIISSSEFQKMCKDMSKINDTVQIRKTSKFKISFTSDAGGIMKNTTEYGESDSDDDDEKNENEYCDVFDVQDLVKISKIGSLSQQIYVYTKEGGALLLESMAGKLGTIWIYIKSKTQIKREIDARNMNGDDYDEDDEDKKIEDVEQIKENKGNKTDKKAIKIVTGKKDSSKRNKGVKGVKVKKSLRFVTVDEEDDDDEEDDVIEETEDEDDDEEEEEGDDDSVEDSD